MKGKHCNKCNRWYPLFMFKKDHRKFQLKIALGKVRNCKICSWKDSKNEVVRWDGTKFQTVKLTLWQRMMELIG